MGELSGVELTARAMGVCGIEVRQHPQRGHWQRSIMEDGAFIWRRVPDWTQPECLHEVVAMAVKAFCLCEVTLSALEDQPTVIFVPDAVAAQDRQIERTATTYPHALLLAVDRAGGVEVGE